MASSDGVAIKAVIIGPEGLSGCFSKKRLAGLFPKNLRFAARLESFSGGFLQRRENLERFVRFKNGGKGFSVRIGLERSWERNEAAGHFE
ncbi:MAG: hypothetical protein LBJ64_00650 [Deltaproteobacteria bacterium]|jgi:hypothetical protein|nr:hypothetical protein [Deltaproteobacteria bacterium]